MCTLCIHQHRQHPGRFCHRKGPSCCPRITTPASAHTHGHTCSPNFLSFVKCIWSWNQLKNFDRKHFHHPKKFSHASLQSAPIPYPKQPLSCFYCCSPFLRTSYKCNPHSAFEVTHVTASIRGPFFLLLGSIPL